MVRSVKSAEAVITLSVPSPLTRTGLAASRPLAISKVPPDDSTLSPEAPTNASSAVRNSPAVFAPGIPAANASGEIRLKKSSRSVNAPLPSSAAKAAAGLRPSPAAFPLIATNPVASALPSAPARTRERSMGIFPSAMASKAAPFGATSMDRPRSGMVGASSWTRRVGPRAIPIAASFTVPEYGISRLRGRNQISPLKRRSSGPAKACAISKLPDQGAKAKERMRGKAKSPMLKSAANIPSLVKLASPARARPAWSPTTSVIFRPPWPPSSGVTLKARRKGPAGPSAIGAPTAWSAGPISSANALTAPDMAAKGSPGFMVPSNERRAE